MCIFSCFLWFWSLFNYLQKLVNTCHTGNSLCYMKLCSYITFMTDKIFLALFFWKLCKTEVVLVLGFHGGQTIEIWIFWDLAKRPCVFRYLNTISQTCFFFCSKSVREISRFLTSKIWRIFKKVCLQRVFVFFAKMSNVEQSI